MASIQEKDVKKSFPQKLIQASKAWKKIVSPALANRETMLKALYSGYYSGGEGQKEYKKHPINLLDRGLSILIPYLVMNDPHLLISSRNNEFRPFAKTTELAFNHLMKEIHFARTTLRPVIRDSMTGLGITKTGIMKSSEVEIFGYTHAVGQVYSDPVDLIDYIGDPNATSFEGFEFEGNYVKIPVNIAKELYPKFADLLSASNSLREAGEKNYDPEYIAKGDVDGINSIREYVQLADFWIPDEGIIITIEPRSGKILKTVESDSPETGPYDKLYYKDFSGTPLPIPPVWYWLDMDRAINIIVNKMRQQAESQKTNLAYEGDAADDAARLAAATDLKTVKVSNIEGIKTIEWPGIDPEHYNWIQYLEQQYSLQGNNLYTLGGRNAGAETLGQEQMLFANASKSIDDMVESVYGFTKSIVNKMVYYFWTDPLISIPQIKRIDGYGEIPVIFDRAAREGEFWDYEFDIEPYSMQRLSPSVEFQRTLSLLTQWILPTASIAAQQGAIINIPKATKHLAKMSGLRGFDDWYESGVPSSETKLNPYTPTQGKVKNNDVQDGRTGMNANSDVANSRQKLLADGNSI